MNTRRLGRSGLLVPPLVFGGNVFGWTADEDRSFALMDRLLDAGLNAIDTADVYSAWVPGHEGGESETIIGKWLARQTGRRSKMLIITKVGGALGPHKKSLSARRIAFAVEESLRRLQTDYIDLYFSHHPDADTPVEETLRAHENLLKQGKVRAIGCSNYSAAQLREALDIASTNQLTGYQVLQPEYNLYDRRGFEAGLRELCVQADLGVIPYFSLAAGFLSGKYRSKDDLVGRARAGMLQKYFDERGLRILDALDVVARARKASAAEVALAWLMSRPGVTAPIASATSLEQLDGLVRATRLSLSQAELDSLTVASAEGHSR